MNASVRHTVKAPSPDAAAATTRSAKLRQMLLSPELEFLMEAHNGLSARIVREAGFKGVWASGLSISAQFGVRDNNEASWTQVVDMLEFMADASDLPILLDGDTGYGNFNNMRRLVRKLDNGHYLVAHEGENKIVREYDDKGQVVWQFEPHSKVYSAIRLANGNTLMGCGDGHRAIEVDPAGEHDFQLWHPVGKQG